MQSEQLINQITEEIFRRLDPAVFAGGDFACEAVCIEKDAEKVRCLIDCGAQRLGLHAAEPGKASDLAGYIDHTLLKPAATREDIEKLCREALEFGFASVCINPCHVATASRVLRGGSPAVCTVAGFPLGANTSDTKAYEARRAIFDGAGEIDMVINIGALKAHQDKLAGHDIEAVAEACREQGAICKVIIEAAYLSEDEKVRACTLAKEAGADFVKTSTGFGPGGATLEDVALMRRAVGSRVGVKAAGGIGDSESTRRMLEAGATRIGASAGVKIVQGQKDDSSSY